MENGNNDDGLGKYKPIYDEYANSCVVIKSIEEEISLLYTKKENNNQKCYMIELKDFENYKE